MKRMAMLAAASLMVLAGHAQAAVTFTPLVVAGGGGGANDRSNGGDAQAGQNGSAASGQGAGAGGTAGGGGSGGTGTYSNAGGGAGVNGAGSAGSAFLSGGNGMGGSTAPTFAGGRGGLAGANEDIPAGGDGGFGGGGGGSYVSSGGGGGYSGGGGAGNTIGAPGGGGGGGSYVDSILTSQSFGLNGAGGNGFVTITPVGGLAQTFNYTGAAETYTFLADGVYSIVAAGGQGANFLSPFVDPDRRYLGGLGAQVGGSAMFTAGSTLSLIVGGQGGETRYLSGATGAGGGGGSFVFLTYAAPPVAAVPEPATWAMMLAGFGLIGGAMRRRQKVATRVTFA